MTTVIFLGLYYFANTSRQILLDKGNSEISATYTEYWISGESALHLSRAYGSITYNKTLVLNNRSHHWQITFSESDSNSSREKVTFTAHTTESGAQIRAYDADTGSMVRIERNQAIENMVDIFLDIISSLTKPTINTMGQIILSDDHGLSLLNLAKSISLNY